jgi:hypothetical protein
MTDLDELDLFPEPDDREPRPCKHPKWRRTIDATGARLCGSCGHAFDPAIARRGRNNRARGGREEKAVAALLGGRKVGPLCLPHDVELPGYMRIQVKQLDRWPSLARVVGWLDAMQPGADVRGVTVADTPGPGGRTRRLLIVDLDEFARWNGDSWKGVRP